jgi:hypothetical protein
VVSWACVGFKCACDLCAIVVERFAGLSITIQWARRIGLKPDLRIVPDLPLIESTYLGASKLWSACSTILCACAEVLLRNRAC